MSHMVASRLLTTAGRTGPPSQAAVGTESPSGAPRRDGRSCSWGFIHSDSGIHPRLRRACWGPGSVPGVYLLGCGVPGDVWEPVFLQSHLHQAPPSRGLLPSPHNKLKYGKRGASSEKPPPRLGSWPEATLSTLLTAQHP